MWKLRLIDKDYVKYGIELPEGRSKDYMEGFSDAINNVLKLREIEAIPVITMEGFINSFKKDGRNEAIILALQLEEIIKIWREKQEKGE